MYKHDAILKVTAMLAVILIGLALTGCAAKQSERTGKDHPQQVNQTTAQRVVDSASSQVGRPYRFGGDSPQRGFDCSGLIYWAYKQHDIDVPRQTTAQAKVGTGISRGQLKPGDIVVFRTSRAPNGLHTGLYAGNDKFIHSPNNKSVVRIESMTPYWQARYLTGRRVTNTRARR